ncbi:MAG: Shikimate kinase [Bacteroidota bacterium]|jgi:shikimate kinase
MSSKPIFLIGMMGSGKSSFALALANALKVPVYDTDLEIEKLTGYSVSELFSEFGEAYFREQEKALIEKLPEQAAVVACGGGLPCYGELMDTLLQRGQVIYLSAPAEVLYERIAGSEDRPLLQDLNSFDLLLQKRKEVYQQANYIIDAQQAPSVLLNDCLTFLSKDLS